MMMKTIQSSAVLLMLYDFMQCAVGNQPINTFSGSVGAGNYTYYRLMQRGFIRIILNTIEGDADLYISSQTLMPTFANYELQSVTCGEDIVDVLPEMHRPVTIGVYGYSGEERTKYLLHVMSVSDYDHGYPEDSMKYDFAVEYQNNPVNSPSKKSFGASVKDEEESILWTILVGILKILLDILM